MSFIAIAPVSASFFQKHTPTKLRATIGSVRQMVAGIGGAIAPAIVGIVADAYGVRIAIFFCAAFMIPIILLYSRLDDENPKRNPAKTLK